MGLSKVKEESTRFHLHKTEKASGGPVTNYSTWEFKHAESDTERKLYSLIRESQICKAIDDPFFSKPVVNEALPDKNHPGTPR